MGVNKAQSAIRSFISSTEGIRFDTKCWPPILELSLSMNPLKFNQSERERRRLVNGLLGEFGTGSFFRALEPFYRTPESVRNFDVNPYGLCSEDYELGLGEWYMTFPKLPSGFSAFSGNVPNDALEVASILPVQVIIRSEPDDIEWTIVVQNGVETH